MWQPTTVGNASAGFMPAVIDPDIGTLINRQKRYDDEERAAEHAASNAKEANRLAREYLRDKMFTH